MRRSVILFLLALVGVAVYAALTARFPIATYLRIPRAGVGSITKWSPNAALLLALAGILLHGAYIAAVLLCWRMTATTSWDTAIVWAYPLAAGTILMLLWPINSTDLFDYIFRGRMGSHYGVNPYTVLPNRYKTDPLFPYLGWPNAPSAYGPLWEMISSRFSALGGTSVWRNLLLQKALALVTFLACGGVIALMTRGDGARVQRLASVLWLWSPLALFEIVGMGHNDGLLVLSMLLAIWAARRGQHHLAPVALVLGALFKFLPLILLPFVVVDGARRRQGWGARLRFAIEIGVIAAVLIVAAYAPYWEGSKTLSNIFVREKFLHAAPFAILIHTLSLWWPIDLVRPLVNRIESVLLGIGLLWQMWHIWRHGRDLRAAFFGLLTWYLILASQWFQPWYVLWLLSLLAVRPDRATFGWVAAWALSSQASYLVQFFILQWLKWPGNQLPAQRIYLLVIFVPPLVVWGIQRWRRRATPPEVSSPAGALATS